MNLLLKFSVSEKGLYILLLFTNLETAEFSPFLATVFFIGKCTSLELVIEFVSDVTEKSYLHCHTDAIQILYR